MSENTLWMLNIQGPDDIIAAPSCEPANAVAAASNAHWSAYLDKQRARSVAKGKDPDHWPTVTAVVIEWDGTPEQHASNLKRYWSGYAEYLKCQETK